MIWSKNFTEKSLYWSRRSWYYKIFEYQFGQMYMYYLFCCFKYCKMLVSCKLHGMGVVSISGSEDCKREIILYYTLNKWNNHINYFTSQQNPMHYLIFFMDRMYLHSYIHTEVFSTWSKTRIRHMGAQV